MNVHKAEFVKSAAAAKDFLRDGRRQIAFAGRSNVGKSSVINRVLQRKNFARVGEPTLEPRNWLYDLRIRTPRRYTLPMRNAGIRQH